ncbi:dinuclear metal center protein, YbgI/SA1388 family [Nakamurella panacisegetis]|uniref:GTP cyclohydrolase 1 type 2 homolog n=1 Tax=Nakamurella panacisegetis TaxID=1090615 RepID=A0A1H0QYU4_9ACTN|nr:Nif3-like dinuclear metal center hexameric protein [Nakamurella panacisegetis]SDP22483.1 dinuclear metal center protein, YbgI/SA1388 family [Nakamurella panacisegetis]
MPVTIGEVIAVLDAAYPPALAEAWDTGIGLTCGDPDEPVQRVLLAVDVDDAVVEQAEQLGAQLLVTHHPLLFRSVQSVAADTAKGSLVHRMIRSGIAHYAAHTNADKAVRGVNDALAAVLGLRSTRPLLPDDPGVLPPGHPQAGRTGSGRVGELATPIRLADLADLVAAALPSTATGVRVAGEANRLITTVAVSGGAGGGFLADAARVGADAVVTSDLSHHVVAEHVADPGRPAVIDVPHWAGEWPWLAGAASVINSGVADRGSAGSVTTTVSALRTDPWTMHRL